MISQRLFQYTYKRAVLILVLLTFGAILLSATPSSPERQIESIEISYALDSSKRYSPATIQGATFVTAQKGKFHANTKNSQAWLRIKVHNTTYEQNALLEFSLPFIRKALLYTVIEGRLVLSSKSGYGIPHSERDIISRNITFPVTLQKGEQVFYVKIDPFRNPGFYIKLKSVHNYYSTEIAFVGINSFYYGIAFIILILNLFYYFSFKDKSFLYYSLTVFCLSLELMHLDGFLVYFFEPGWFIDTADLIVDVLLIYTSGILFASHFLDTRTFFPWSRWLDKGAFITILISYSLYIITKGNFFYVYGLFGMLAMFLYYWVLSFLLIKKNPFAIFYIVGYFSILFSCLSIFIPLSFNYETLGNLFFLKIGGVLEMVIFTYAVIYRMNILKKENLDIKQKIVEYLDELQILKQKNIEIGSDETAVKKMDFTQIQIDFNLTEREVDVIAQIVQHKTNSQIAEALFISVNTVKYHTQNIYTKLNVKGRVEVVERLGIDSML